MHQLLDAAGKDQITADEAEVLYPSVFSAEAVQIILRALQFARTMATRGTKFAIESNVIWHGRVNPKRHPIIPVREVPTGTVYDRLYERYGFVPGAYNPSRRHD